MAKGVPVTIIIRGKETVYNSQEELEKDLKRIYEEAGDSKIEYRVWNPDTQKFEKPRSIKERYFEQQLNEGKVEYGKPKKEEKTEVDNIVDNTVSKEIEITQNLPSKQRDILNEIEEELEDIKGDINNEETTQKILDLENRKKQLLDPTLKEISRKKREDKFEIRNKRVKDIIEQLDIDFELDVSETSEEYLEKIEMDLRRQSNELDLMLDQIQEDNKKSILLQQKQIVNNELKLLEGGIDPNTGVFQKSKGAQSTMETHGVMSLDNSFAYINKQASLEEKTGNINVAAHEFLHKLMFQTIRKNPAIQLAVGKELHNYIIKINPSQVKNSQFRQRLINYNNNYDQIEDLVNRSNQAKAEGDIETYYKLDNQRQELEGRLSPQQAEEVLNLFSDAIYYGDLSLSEKGLNRVGDMYRRILRSSGVKAKFKTGRDVYNFIKDFNKSIETGKASAALIKEAKEGIELGGDILKGVGIIREGYRQMGVDADLYSSVMTFSKANADEVNRIYKEKGKEGAFEIAELYRGMANEIYNRYVNQLPSDLRAWIAQQETFKEDVINGMLFASYGFVNKGTKNRSVVGMVRNEFDIAKQAFGNLAAYINTFLPRRAIQEFKDMLPQEAKLPEGDDISPKKPKRKIEGGKIALETLGSGKLHEEIRGIVATSGLKLPDSPEYKDVKKLLTSHDGAKKSQRVPTGELFPVLEKLAADLFGDSNIALRAVREVDLTTKQRTAIQDYIRRKTPELITYVIPKGTSKEGKATGAANTKLGVLYTEGARSKTPAGLKEQKKLHINPDFLLEQAGMVKGQPTVKTTKVDPFLRSMFIQIAVISSNQAIRQEKEALDLTEKQILRLQDGKPSLSFSKPAKKPTSPLETVEKTSIQSIKNKLQKVNKDYKIPNNKTETGRNEHQEWWEKVVPKYLPVTTKRGQANFLNNANAAQSSRLETEIKKGKRRLGAKDNNQYLIAGKNNTRLQALEQAIKNQSHNLTEDQKAKLYEALVLKRRKYYNNDFSSKEYQLTIKRHWEGVEILLNQLAKMAKENPSTLKHIAANIIGQGTSNDHWVRTMAIPRGKEKGVKIRDDGSIQDGVSEHVFFAGEAAQYIFDMISLDRVKEMLPFLKDNYYTIAITNKTNNILKNQGYEKAFSLEYQEKFKEEYENKNFKGLPNPLVRYVEAGIDLNTITWDNGKTIAENFGLGVNKKQLPDEVLNTQRSLFKEIVFGERTKNSAEKYNNSFSKIPFSLDNIKNTFISNVIQASRPASKYKEAKGMSVFDFDDTVATTKSKVYFSSKDGLHKGELNAEEYAAMYADMLDAGYTFDFSDFVIVKGGKKGPLFAKLKKQVKKYGVENVFILTARPPQSATAIKEWLKTNGVNLPLKNITGLGNSTGEAKADWMLGKFYEGYNDMYFVDDALANVTAVKNVLNQLDIKSKVVQAKLNDIKRASEEFNRILQITSGVQSVIKFSDAQAKLRGKGYKFTGLIPPSAQDFAGLLYSFLPKGKRGEEAMKFFKKTLIDPFARGINELNMSRQKAMESYDALLKSFPGVKKKLRGKVEGTSFNYDQAVRVYLWKKLGFEVPGLSQRDTNALTSVVKNNPELQAFADALGVMSKRKQGYAEPGEYWLVENIASDLFSDGALGNARAEYLAEWQENVDEIFSKDNLNKIQAIYGNNFREALEDVLFRMKTGKNRKQGSNRLLNNYYNWVNGSVGAIMFFNIRSAVLQTISAINYINWSDNNPLAAATAFANQRQYWKDFAYLFNSDMLKQRRAGNRRGVNESELMNAVIGSSNPAKAAIAWLLNKGFLPTQIADSFAIAAGGATFYRNRVNKYIKDGMSRAEAEKQAFLDFQEVTEVSQQSARPDLISQQQANPLGRLILAFANTPMQYGRIMDKAFRDTYNKRGDTKTNFSKILYYGAIQAILFTALQSAIFAALGDDDEEILEKKKDRMLNSIMDTWLTTFGFGGKALGTLKNTLMEYDKQRAKDLDEDFMTRSDHAYTLLAALGFSPPIGSKVRKIYQSIQTEKFNREIMKERGFTLDNPAWSAFGYVIEAVTNIPLGRLSTKMRNLDNALDSRNETWQRVALLFGWNTWDLGIKDQDIEALGENIKERKKQEKKMKKEKEKAEKEKAKLREEYPGKTDKEIEETILKEEKIKQIFDLKKREQVKIIEQLKLNPKDYRLEQDRVDIIMEKYNENPDSINKMLEDIKNYKPTKEEQRSIELYDMNKKEQVNLLMSLGLSSKQIKKLKYEKDRVNKIIELQNKRKK